MATIFTKGQQVKVRAVTPQGAVQAFRMDEDGNVYCWLIWTDVDGMMTKVADFYDVEAEATVASLTSLIEPLLIVFLGVVVGGIVMAMFLPIFELGAVAGGLQ